MFRALLELVTYSMVALTLTRGILDLVLSDAPGLYQNYSTKKKVLGQSLAKVPQPGSGTFFRMTVFCLFGCSKND